MNNTATFHQRHKKRLFTENKRKLLTADKPNEEDDTQKNERDKKQHIKKNKMVLTKLCAFFSQRQQESTKRNMKVGIILLDIFLFC